MTPDVGLGLNVHEVVLSVFGYDFSSGVLCNHDPRRTLGSGCWRYPGVFYSTCFLLRPVRVSHIFLTQFTQFRILDNLRVTYGCGCTNS